MIQYFKTSIFIVFTAFCLMGCSSSEDNSEEQPNNPTPSEDFFYYGADLSYVNEMEDCGATYKNTNNEVQDPFQIFANAGTNLVRVRLWHNPTWTNYSNIEDVKQTIQRAKSLGMKVLLDFHYSDTWADPETQETPAAWIPAINNTTALGSLLYDYTLETLNDLNNSGLTPDMVQVGNEINGMILQQGDLVWPIDWNRNSFLLNKGIQAIRDFSQQHSIDIEIMLHIAQPENGIWWFEQATANGVTDYDWIGLSYYPIWSSYDLNNVGSALSSLITTYDKKLMIVETAYPFTLDNADTANNILDSDALINGFPATQEGQLNYLLQLETVVKEAGGEGIIYWEPAWVSTDCSTLWGQGSHWDNATLFDHNNKANLGMQFYNGSQTNN